MRYSAKAIADEFEGPAGFVRVLFDGGGGHGVVGWRIGGRWVEASEDA